MSGDLGLRNHRQTILLKKHDHDYTRLRFRWHSHQASVCIPTLAHQSGRPLSCDGKSGMLSSAANHGSLISDGVTSSS